MAVERTAIGNYVTIDRARRASASGRNYRPGTGCGAAGARRRRGLQHSDQGRGAARNPAPGGGPGARPDVQHRQVRDGHAVASRMDCHSRPDRPHRDVGKVRTGGRPTVFRRACRTHRRRNPRDPADGHRIDGPRACRATESPRRHRKDTRRDDDTASLHSSSTATTTITKPSTRSPATSIRSTRSARSNGPNSTASNVSSSVAGSTGSSRIRHSTR